MTLVLSGGYVEAGDEGRRRVGPGDVLVHRPFESHLDRFGASGADVFILPLPDDLIDGDIVGGVTTNPDAVVRVAERDINAAVRLLLSDIRPGGDGERDWPDELASSLASLKLFSLSDWAACAGLRPETISRGFRQAYGSSPKAFRATARARAALSAIRARPEKLSSLAAELGFADQAHMSRAVVALTGHPPSEWRPVAT
ncbi:helix-turn-helix domain-containing protein [Sphingomonas sp. UYAg733]